MRANLIQGNALCIPLKSDSVQCVVTSPPYYGLRDYGEEDQLGLEPTLDGYIENTLLWAREVWRVLRDDGTFWLNIGDSYNGSGKHAGSLSRLQKGNRGTQTKLPFAGYTADGMKPKDLMGVPWRVALALQADGWYLRSDIIWHKPNPMPESVTDRPTKAHEYIFLLSKSARYYYDADAIREPIKGQSCERANRAVSGNHKNLEETAVPPGMSVHSMHKKRARGDGEILMNRLGRNKRTVWTITTKPYSGSHFATFPTELPEICILAGSKEGDIILDPFNGSGTTVMVAQSLKRIGVGLDLSWDYLQLARDRTGLSQMDEWLNGKKDNSNYDDLPLFQ